MIYPYENQKRRSVDDFLFIDEPFLVHRYMYMYEVYRFPFLSCNINLVIKQRVKGGCQYVSCIIMSSNVFYYFRYEDQFFLT